MKCLVTGGAGFVGSNLALYLLSQGHDVLITGNTEEQQDPVLLDKCLQYEYGSLEWEKIGKVDVVFHQAANNDTTLLDRNEFLKVNVEATKRLLEGAIAQGCKRIVYASSTAVYGNGPVPPRETEHLKPLNPYGESKLLVDQYVQELVKEHPNIIIVGLRYCNVYGPRENHKGKRANMVFQLAHQMVKGNPKLFKFGEQQRDYIYVKDVITANMLASQAKESCIVNCAFGKATSFNDIVKCLNTVLNVERTPEYIDNPYEDKYQTNTECDMSLAKEKLGFVPEWDIKKGITNYYDSGWLTKESQ